MLLQEFKDCFISIVTLGWDKQADKDLQTTALSTLMCLGNSITNSEVRAHFLSHAAFVKNCKELTAAMMALSDCGKNAAERIANANFQKTESIVLQSLHRFAPLLKAVTECSESDRMISPEIIKDGEAIRNKANALVRQGSDFLRKNCMDKLQSCYDLLLPLNGGMGNGKIWHENLEDSPLEFCLIFLTDTVNFFYIYNITNQPWPMCSSL